MANPNPDTSNLRPDAASKGELRQSSIQLPPESWEYLDSLVEQAKSDSRCIYTGRIGRGDIINGLILAAQLSAEGLSVPVELIAIGVHWDEDGDCLVCGGAGYHPLKGVDVDCPLCKGKG